MSKINFLIIGPIGTGKTSCLRTVPAAGKSLRVIATEPGIENILGELRAQGQDVHWKYIAPAAVDWDTMIDNAKKINNLPAESLQKLPGVNRQSYRQFVELLETCADFTCDCCGQNFGAVDSWDDSVVLGIDGLSGISTMAMDLVSGGKPVKTQQDWQVAMDNLERFLNKMTTDTKCSFVLIAHLEREHDEITGATKLTVSTLGRKLAPRIPRFFDEVVLAKREGKKFYWSSMETGVDLKSRRLPIADEIPPDLGPILKDIG